MCELLTIAAAVLFTALFAASRRRGKAAGALGTTALAFWGAALMWSVDCVHSLMEGEGLLDFSLDDAKLGAVIIATGLLLYVVLAIREKRETKAVVGA